MKANHVMLIGYVGKDLQTLKCENGSNRVAIRIATHYVRKSEQGEKNYQTVWHNVVAWNKIADYAERNFVKGSRIMVDGSINYRTFQDYEGHTRHMTLITAHALMNLDR